MWPYFGAKTELVDHYPPPIHGTIIEPFAGTAIYSWKYWDRKVILYDSYIDIIKIWKWLQIASASDILKIPRPTSAGQWIDDLGIQEEGARLLMGFMAGYGYKTPARKMSPHIKQRPNWVNYRIEKLAANIDKIRHWEVVHGSYESIKNVRATWFIDPPYQYQGKGYKKGSRHIDYKQLAEFCISREGQVIVCEADPAAWLPFRHLTTAAACNNKLTREMIFYQEDQVSKQFKPVQGFLF